MPCYNEEAIVGQTCGGSWPRLSGRHFPGSGRGHNGSTDRTGEILETLSAKASCR